MFEPLLPVNFLRRAARLFPDKVAVVDGERRDTYRTLAARVNRLSNALRQMGVGQGDKVAVLSPNSHRMLEAFFAVPQLGAILTPLNYRLSTPEFAYILEHSETRVVLVDWEYAQQLAPLVDTLKGIWHYVLLRDAEPPTAALPAQDYEDVLAAASPEFPTPVEVAETDIATLNYTSGTTARPKGVMLSHRACVTAALNYIVSLNVRPTDVYLHTLPMFHANGWGGIWALAGLGGTQVCLRRVEAQTIFTLLQAEAVTLACAAPTVLVTLANFPRARDYRLAAHLRLGTGGSPPAAAVLRHMEALGIEVVHLYGLTETGPFLTSCEWQPAWDALDVAERYRLKARQGIAQLLTDVRVMDEDMREVPTGRHNRRRDRGPWQQRHGRLLQAARGDRQGHAWRLVSHRRSGRGARRWLHRDRRSRQGCDQQRRGEYFIGRGGSHALRASGGARSRRHRRPR